MSNLLYLHRDVQEVGEDVANLVCMRLVRLSVWMKICICS